MGRFADRRLKLTPGERLMGRLLTVLFWWEIG